MSSLACPFRGTGAQAQSGATPCRRAVVVSRPPSESFPKDAVAAPAQALARASHDKARRMELWPESFLNRQANGEQMEGRDIGDRAERLPRPWSPGTFHRNASRMGRKYPHRKGTNDIGAWLHSGRDSINRRLVASKLSLRLEEIITG